MPELIKAIGAYDATTRTVPVTFTMGDIAHSRDVNACHDAAGEYDAAATADRVDQVAAGVAAKISVGAITNPPDPVPVEDPATREDQH